MSHEDFFQSILAQPFEASPRMIFADWLEEQGDARAALLRRFTPLFHRKLTKGESCPRRPNRMPALFALRVARHKKIWNNLNDNWRTASIKLELVACGFNELHLYPKEYRYNFGPDQVVYWAACLLDPKRRGPNRDPVRCIMSCAECSGVNRDFMLRVGNLVAKL